MIKVRWAFLIYNSWVYKATYAGLKMYAIAGSKTIDVYLLFNQLHLIYVHRCNMLDLYFYPLNLV
jgi:hypothetical protein